MEIIFSTYCGIILVFPTHTRLMLGSSLHNKPLQAVMTLSDTIPSEATVGGLLLAFNQTSICLHKTPSFEHSVYKQFFACAGIIASFPPNEVHSNWVETNRPCICEINIFVYKHALKTERSSRKARRREQHRLSEFARLFLPRVSPPSHPRRSVFLSFDWS